jgi:plastocyanin
MNSTRMIFWLKSGLLPPALLAACVASVGMQPAAPVKVNLENATLQLSEPTSVTASVVSVADRPSASPPMSYIGPCYRFLPEAELDGINTLTLRYSPGDARSAPEEGLSIYWYDTYGATWVEVPSAVDTDAKTVVAGISKLGMFALSAPQPEETSASAAGTRSRASAPLRSAPSQASMPISASSSGAEAVTLTVSMVSFQYIPREITVPAGTTVTWVNDDPVEHTVTADATNPTPGGPSSDTDFPNGISQGQSWSWQVPLTAANGTRWFYHCRFHGLPGDGTSLGAGMTGSITIFTFTDVPVTLAQAEYIYAIARAGITAGCSANPPMYCPEASVTRAQMAKFLCLAAVRTILNSPTPTFADVPPTLWAYGYVERLADAASWGGNPPTSGCHLVGTTTYFCPFDFVTRAQMAKFLCLAAAKTTLNSPTPTFADVPPTLWAYGYVERLADAASWPGGVAVTTGCACPPGFPAGSRCYCPFENITRRQMAVFLVRAFGIPL